MAFEYDEGMDIAKDMQQAAAKDSCRPRFFLDKEKNEFESKKQGRPIYFDVEKVETFIPGEAKLRPIETVNDEHKQRWPREYDAFKRGQELPIEGTPIENWARLTPGQVARFKMEGIRTVEDIAGLSDGNLQGLGPGGFKLRDDAKLFVKPAPLREQTLHAELAKRDAQINQMLAELAQMRAQPPVVVQASPTVMPVAPQPRNPDEDAPSLPPLPRKPLQKGEGGRIARE